MMSRERRLRVRPGLLALAAGLLLLGGATGVLVGARAFPTRTVTTRTLVERVTHNETVLRLESSRPKTVAKINGATAFALGPGRIVWAMQPYIYGGHVCERLVMLDWASGIRTELHVPRVFTISEEILFA